MVAYTPHVAELSPSVPYPGVSDAVQACVDLYGITDLLTRQSTEADGTPNGNLRDAGLFPEKRGEKLDKWRLASPVTHISSNAPPTLILHGLRDTTVDRDQSIELAKKLKEAGVPHQLDLLPGIGHTFDLDGWKGKPLPIEFRPLLLGFLDKHLRPDR
jgi:dipeptidyl aminopeptidase/acylaminoacyl peptidase